MLEEDRPGRRKDVGFDSGYPVLGGTPSRWPRLGRCRVFPRGSRLFHRSANVVHKRTPTTQPTQYGKTLAIQPPFSGLETQQADPSAAERLQSSK